MSDACVFILCILCMKLRRHSISLIMPFFLYTIDLPTPSRLHMSKKHPNQNVSVFWDGKIYLSDKVAQKQTLSGGSPSAFYCIYILI